MKTRRVGTPAEPGLAEELLYDELLSYPRSGEVLPALVALKNGGLMTGFWYQGPDLEAANEQHVGRICAGVHSALEVFGQLGGWVVHFEGMRRKLRGHIPRQGQAMAVDAVCDDERASRAEFYDSNHAMFLTYLEARDDAGILGRVEKFARGQIGLGELLGGAGEVGAEAEAAALIEAVRVFEQRVENIGRVLKAAGIAVTRMQSSRENCEISQALNYVCNGTWQTVRPPPRGSQLDILLAQGLLVEPSDDGVTVQHGDRSYQIVEPVRFPEESWANMLQTLEQLGVEWRRSTRAIFVGTSEAVSQLEEKEKRWDGLRNRLGDFGKIVKRTRKSAVAAADEVGDALADVESGQRFGVHVTNVVVVMGESTAAAREAAREVERAFQLSGFLAHTQKKNARQALLGSFPGHGYYNVRRPFVDSLNLVHMLSLSTEWGGEPVIPSRLYPSNSPPLMQATARSKSRFYVNLHQAPAVGVKSGAARNEDTAHAAVFGPVGAGKSALANALASQFLARYADSRVVFLDNGYSAYKLARSRGKHGVHYALGAEGVQLHPFARIRDPRWMSFANDFISGIAVRQGTRYSELERLAVSDALKRVALGQRPEDRSLRDLWHAINEPRHLKDMIEHFIQGGGRGVIDGVHDNIEAARFTCFELGELLNRDTTVAQAGLHYLLEWVRSVPDGAPTLLILDEAGLALRDPMVAGRLTEFVLRGRKENVHVVLLFHSPRQLLESPVAATVLDNVQTRFWLPNPEAASKAGKEGYQEMGVSPELLALIATAQRKREYVYQSNRYARVFSLDLGPVQRAFWTYDGRSDLDLVRKLEAEYGDWWPREYLERVQLLEHARRWEKLEMAARRLRGAA